MRISLAVCAVVLALAAGTRSARADAGWRRVVLVELYTSQGCSSCPAAERLVRDLPKRGLGHDKVLPLAFHVDYWDRLGWPDRFATPAFTERQDWYARSGQLRAPDAARELTGLYTPQMIVDGQVHFPGGQSDVALAAFAAAAGRPAPVALTGRAMVAGNIARVAIHLAGGQGLAPSGDWRLTAALVQRQAETRVLHGENGGETLAEASIVRALSARQPLTPGAADAPTITLEKPGDLAWSDVRVVAFVQSERTREIAGAVELIPNAAAAR